jgi:hypothetical protein
MTACVRARGGRLRAEDTMLEEQASRPGVHSSY